MITSNIVRLATSIQAARFVWLVLFLGCEIGYGDIMTFRDATDYGGTLDVVSSNPARTMVSSVALGLNVRLLPPSPTATFLTDQCPLGQIGCLHVNIGEYPIDSHPDLDFESDIFQGFPDHGAYQMFITIQTAFPCFAEGGCLVREDGLLHTLDTVTWSDGTVDAIEFQSTPEVSSLALLATVSLLIGLIASRRRRSTLWNRAVKLRRCFEGGRPVPRV
jgi:hypothetical protein